MKHTNATVCYDVIQHVGLAFLLHKLVTTHDVPKQYTKVSFDVWKGNTDSGIKLASVLATTNKGFASEAFNIDWNSGDGDYYTVCYQGRMNGPAMDYSAPLCSLTVHHADREPSHLRPWLNWYGK